MAEPDARPGSPRSNDSLARNVEVARRIILEVIDQSRLDLADELVAPDYVEHRPNGDGPDGVEGLKAWVRTVHEGFPDWRHEITGAVAQGDRVVLRSTLYGTHTGEFQGIPATGRTIEQFGYDELRISDGRMVEHWGEYDWLGFYQQLGVVPESVGKGK
jgi:predicted ester cyclase